MARTHNDRLRVFLRLPPAVDDPKVPENIRAGRRDGPSRRPRVSVLPAIVQGGAGFVLGGTF